MVISIDIPKKSVSSIPGEGSGELSEEKLISMIKENLELNIQQKKKKQNP